MFCASGADARFCLHKLHSTRGARRDFSIFRLNEDINTWTISPELISHSTSILSKTSLISYEHTELFLIEVRFNLLKILCQK